MNIKKIMILSVLAVMLLGCISTASAGWFDFLTGNTEINGVEFKIPEGYKDDTPKENNTQNEDNTEKSKGKSITFNTVKNYEEKLFTKEDSNANSGIYRIYIKVYNNSDNQMKLPNEGKGNENITTTFYGSSSEIANELEQLASNNITWEAKEISGHKGMLGVYGSFDREKWINHEFDYIDGDKYIKIYFEDSSVLDELITSK